MAEFVGRVVSYILVFETLLELDPILPVDFKCFLFGGIKSTDLFFVKIFEILLWIRDWVWVSCI